MIPTIIIASATFVLITLSILFFPSIKIGKIKIGTYWVIALIGAIILLAFSLAPIKDVGKQLVSSSSINPLKILVLFFSMTLISIFLDEMGLFRHLANLASKKAKGNQYALFLILFGLISILTIFTSNDIVILTFTPFICFFCKNSKINPIPYLVMEFAAANTWSLMFVIGNPTNIYLATSFGIDFISYIKVMAVPTLFAGITELGILLLLFHKKLKLQISISEEETKIENKPLLFIGIAHLAICLVFLIISSYINFEMWLISLIAAGSLLLFSIGFGLYSKENWKYLTGSLKRLPYQLIPFFISMFVIVVAFNYQGISSQIAQFFGNSHSIWIYGYTSFIASNLINNIPMSILYSNICNNYQAVYASIVGSNIGAFLTPIGALAGIMFTSLVNKCEVKYSFLDFIKYGVIVSLPVITVALLTLNLFI